jgi:protoporphyrinogen oxidase
MLSDQTKPWVVVGGGMLGMTLALRLAQRGQRVTLLEAAPNLGGLADAWQLGEITWDRHYHVTLLSDYYLRNLLSDIGLEQDLCWRETKTGFLVDGQLLSFSNIWDFLRFPPLSLFDKFRLGLTINYASRVRDGLPLEAIPVGDWLRKLSGVRTFEKIWLPLLKAKLGENHVKASAAFIWTTIQRMYAARRTGLKKEMFGYVRGGYARVLERLRSKLTAAGVEIVTSFPVAQVDSLPDGGYKIANEEQTLFAERVVLTVPAPVAARICPELSSSEQAKLQGVEYQGIICASVLMQQPLAKYYVTNITDEVPFTAVIEMTTLVDREEVGGHCLTYLPKYISQDSPLWNESDAELEARFIAALEQIYPHFRREQVLAFRVSRVKHVMPIPTLNYSSRLPPQITSLPGLYLVNSAHIVNGTLNVNETIKLAEQSLELICQDATSTSSPCRSAHVATIG